MPLRVSGLCVQVLCARRRLESALKACSQSYLSRDAFAAIAASRGARAEPSKSPALPGAAPALDVQLAHGCERLTSGYLISDGRIIYSLCERLSEF